MLTHGGHAGSDVSTRRGFLLTGGRALAGATALLLTGRLGRGGRAAGVADQARVPDQGNGAGDTVEIRMLSDPSGARVRFDPAGVRVRPGDTVRWVLAGGVHTTTSYHPDNGRPLRMPRAAAPWDSGYLMTAGETFEVMLQSEGVYDFFCRPHEAAGMVGRIVVTAAGDPDSAVLEEPDYPARGSAGTLPPAAVEAIPTVADILAAGAVSAGAG